MVDINQLVLQAAALGGFPDASGEMLARIVERLAEDLSPLRLYVFGSVARCEGGPDSDYDLLAIVLNEGIGGLEASRHAARLLWGVPFAADVLVMRESRFSAEARVRGSLAETVLTEGRVVYERAQ